MAERFLAIKPSSFGDIIHLFPALDVLKKAFPDAVLDFVVNPEFAPLLEFSPFPVENIICFERRKLAEFPGCVPEFFKLRSRSCASGRYWRGDSMLSALRWWVLC